MTNSKKVFITVLIFSVVVNSVGVITQWLIVSPWGSPLFLCVPILLNFPILIALLLVSLSLIASIFKRIRRQALLWLFSALIYSCIGLLLLQVGEIVRMHGLSQLAKRSAVLVEAIHHYDQDKGHPPESLVDLVPEYISHVPKTDMSLCPEYIYIVNKETKWHDYNTWVLYVDTPDKVLLSHEMLIYLPEQNYSKYTGSVHPRRFKKVDNWAYFYD